jgi:hypothetical protein
LLATPSSDPDARWLAHRVLISDDWRRMSKKLREL